MGGFKNYLTTKLGQLVIAAIQSPNFAAGLAGWIVRKDGSAEFNNLTIRGVFNGTDFIINSSGAFFYNGTPASGNLIASITTASGTDPYGNPYQSTITGYKSGTSAFTQIANGIIKLQDTSANDWALVAFLAATIPYLAVEYSGSPVLFISKTGMVTALQPGTTSPETWHSMSLINGWANSAGNTVARYRKVASPPNSVQIMGVISAAAATAGTFFTLPAGYVPAGVGGFAAGANASVSASQAPQIRYDASGNLSSNSVGLGTSAAVWFNGFIPLD